MPQALIRVARGQANRYLIADARSLAVSAPHRHARFGSRNSMNSFELNKILGAVLGTCLVLLSRSISQAGAISRRTSQRSPGSILPSKTRAAVRNRVHQGTDNRSKPFSRKHQWKKVRRPRSNAWRATRSRRAGPNRVGPDLYNIVGSDRGEGRGGFNFSAAMKAKGGKWTFDELNKFLANPRLNISRERR